MRRLLIAFFALGVGLPAAAPRRIVSTAPSFTETLFALGLGDRVVGVSAYCHYPPEVDRLPRAGSYLQPNVEAIARMRPDLVLVHSELKDAVTQMAALGIQTLGIRNTTLDDVFLSVRRIADAAGESARGVALERKLRERLGRVSSRLGRGKAKRVLFLIGRTPGRLDGMNAVGSGSYLNELIANAGGQNVLADSPVAYPQISLEGILRLRPDVIIDMGDMAAAQSMRDTQRQAVVELWKQQPGITARVFAVAGDVFVVPGPRVVDAAEMLAEMLR